MSIVGGAALLAVLGLALGLAQATTMAMVADAATRRHVGGALGLRIAVNRLTQICLPALIGLVSTGATGVFAAFAVLLLGASWVARRSR